MRNKFSVDESLVDNVISLIKNEDIDTHIAGLLLACSQGYDFLCYVAVKILEINKKNEIFSSYLQKDFYLLNSNSDFLLLKIVKNKITFCFKDNCKESILYSYYRGKNLMQYYKKLEIFNPFNKKGKLAIKNLSKINQYNKEEKLNHLNFCINYYYKKHQEYER